MATLIADKGTLADARKHLRVFFPEVGASHIAEALAAALGFNTNAALLTELKKNEPRRALRLDYPRFKQRLTELGYAADVLFPNDWFRFSMLPGAVADAEDSAAPAKIGQLGLFRHREHGGLYEARSEGTHVEVARQGGGFVYNVPVNEFPLQFEPADHPRTLYMGKVSAEFIPEYEMIPCYTTGERWNGFGVPLFDRNAARRVVELLGGDDGMSLRWDGDDIVRPNFYFDPGQPVSADNEPLERFPPAGYEVDGKPITLWCIGDGWVWDSVEPDNPELDPHGGR